MNRNMEYIVNPLTKRQLKVGGQGYNKLIDSGKLTIDQLYGEGNILIGLSKDVNVKDDFSGYVVIDIETTGLSRDINHITTVCIYDSITKEYLHYNDIELKKLFDYIKCRPLVGHNIEVFDIPFLKSAGYVPDKDQKIFDIMKFVRKTSGRQAKLDDLCYYNLGNRKSGDGLWAISLYHEGKIDELKEYCQLDVELTHELFLYGMNNKIIKCDNRLSCESWHSIILLDNLNIPSKVVDNRCIWSDNIGNIIYCKGVGYWTLWYEVQDIDQRWKDVNIILRNSSTYYAKCSTLSSSSKKKFRILVYVPDENIIEVAVFLGTELDYRNNMVFQRVVESHKIVTHEYQLL
jgi:hypothetical protein